MKPGIRFGGEFTDAWEQRKFKDNIVSIQTGTNLLGAEANSGGVPLLKWEIFKEDIFPLINLNI